jgi:hypothetical protein
VAGQRLELTYICAIVGPINDVNKSKKDVKLGNGWAVTAENTTK